MEIKKILFVIGLPVLIPVFFIVGYFIVIRKGTVEICNGIKDTIKEELSA